MRENREKGGNTDTSAGWKNLWVASGLSTEAEGSCQPGGRHRIHVPGQPRASPCHHPTLLSPSHAGTIPCREHPASHAVIPDLLPLLKARRSSAAICPSMCE